MQSILSSVKGKVNRLLSTGTSRDSGIDALYNNRGYLDAYSEHTNMRVKQDPHEAVGGMWEEIGNLQFGFLVKKGLQPEHRMLDIGCGTLRGGQHFIQYLNAGNYSGMDISPTAIEFAEQLVIEKGLSPKRARLVVSTKKDLKFEEFSGELFDYILAQSVFTHLKPENIEECFENIGRIMATGSRFFFTFDEASKYKQISVKDFRYPFSFFETITDRYGFRLVDCRKEYDHPRSQRMLMVVRIEV